MSKQQEALAATLGMDVAELREYRYQPTRTAIPVYAIGDTYYCVSQTNPGNLNGMNWERMSDQFWAEMAKTVCWKSEVEA